MGYDPMLLTNMESALPTTLQEDISDDFVLVNIITTHYYLAAK